MKNIRLLLLSGFLTFLLTDYSYAKNIDANIKKYTQAQYIMGTIYHIELYSNNKQKAEMAINNAFKEIRKCDLLISNYRDDSELAKVLDEAYSHPVKVSDDFFYITKRALYFSKITNGLFDITIAPLVELWGFKNKDFKKPSDQKIKDVKSKIGYQNIILDETDKTIYLKSNQIKMDFGAIGKGFAVDKAVQAIKSEGITSGVVDCVSSQYYIGSPPNEKYWKVGVKNPRDLNKIMKYIYIKDKSIATSGDYEQFFIENNQRYNHTINPKTGYPIKDAVASTIVLQNATDADALSSCTRLLDEVNTKKLLKIFPGLSITKIKSENKKLKIIQYN